MRIYTLKTSTKPLEEQKLNTKNEKLYILLKTMKSMTRKMNNTTTILPYINGRNLLQLKLKKKCLIIMFKEYSDIYKNRFSHHYKNISIIPGSCKLCSIIRI